VPAGASAPHARVDRRSVICCFPSGDVNVTEVRIPIPFGASLVTMDWDFFNRECSGVPPTNLFYDGMSVDVVTTGGVALQNLLFVDTTNRYCKLP
jgi:hypothetical protein